MTIPGLLLIAVAIWTLARFLVAPKLEHRIRVVRNVASMSTAATLAIVRAVESVSLIAAASTLMVIATVGLLQLTGGATAAAIGNVIIRLQSWREWLSSLDWWWSTGAAVCAVVMLIALAHRNAKRRVTQLFSERYNQEFERLKREYEAGRWEDLPPTAEMQQVDEQAAAGQRILQQLDREASADKPSREHVVDVLNQLAQRRLALDVHRRMHLDLDPEQVLGPPPRTWQQKLATFFVSQGLLGSLQGVSRGLFVAGMALLVPSLLGVQLPFVTEAIASRELRLADLQVQASQREARAEWERAMAAPPAAALPPDDSGDDEQALNALSRHYEDGFAELLSRRVALRPSVVSLRTQATRKQILDVVARDSAGHVGAIPSLSEADGLDDTTREAVSAYEKTFDSPAPRTEIGRRFRSGLDQIRQHDRPLWRRMKAGVRDSLGAFQRASSTDDLGRFLLSRVAGSALDPQIPDGPLGELVKEVQHAVRPQDMQRAYDTVAFHFMGDVASGKSAAEATANVTNGDFVVFTDRETGAFAGVMRHQAWGDELQRRPPTLVAEVEKFVNYDRAAQEADAIHQAAAGGRRTATELADAMMEYDDLFPAQHAGETKTKRAEVVRRWDPDEFQVTSVTVPDPDEPRRPPVSGWGDSPIGGGGGGGGGFGGGGFGGGHGTGPRPPLEGPPGGMHGAPRPVSSMRPASAVRPSAGLGSFARARSFGGLRGFFRIGGVLIGTDPEIDPNEEIDFRDIVWTDNPGGLVLTLTRVDGKTFSLGPFRRQAVERALAYAADDRRVTVTMVSAPPLAELKILVHPALVDSAIGCRAIQIDRLVDTYTGSSDKRSEAERGVEEQNALYQYAWAVRAQALTTLLEQKSNLDEEERGFFRNLRGRANAVKRESAKDATHALQIGFVTAPRESPIVSKDAFFEKALVADIGACARDAKALDPFGKCIEQRATANAREYFSRGGPRWFALPPEFQIWSGVRELPWKLDGDLAFLKLPPGADPQLWPFEFILQVAFTSAPAHLPNRQDVESYTDDNPWEFPDLKQFIAEAVRNGIGKDQHYADVVHDMHDFTLLQRLFRVALDGQLVKRNVPVFTGFCPVAGIAGVACTAAGGLQNIGPSAGQTHSYWEKPAGNASVTLVKGSHTYKAGGEVFFQGVPNIPYSNTNGNYTISANETALPYLTSSGGQSLTG